MHGDSSAEQSCLPDSDLRRYFEAAGRILLAIVGIRVITGLLQTQVNPNLAATWP